MADEEKDKEMQKESMKGWAMTLLTVFLAIKVILNDVFGIEIPWSSINSAVAIILAVAGAFGAYRNNYIGKGGVSQYNLLKNSNMLHMFKEFKKDVTVGKEDK